MIIKKAKYKTVTVKQKRMVSDEVYGCDECKKEIKEFPNEDPRLNITVFYHAEPGTDNYHFCSWECVLKFIPKINTDYFINLPHVCYDSNNKHKNAQGLIDAITKKRKLK